MQPQKAPGIFRSPLDAYSPEQALAYFQRRDTVRYFPAVDETQTTRAKTDAVLAGRFDFNDEVHHLSLPSAWLSNPSTDLEWHILLHKFYYAVGLGAAFAETADERYARCWIELTDSWIENVPVDFLTSDVAGRRIQNWIYAHYYFVERGQSRSVTAGFYRKFLRSLHQQVTWLCEHLTPARNHRTLELTALFLAAVVFREMRGADEWLELARRELLSNMQADLLQDGVQCELSTDYHHLVLRNYLAVRQLAQLNRIPLPPQMDELIVKALQFAVWAHKPDGTIPSLSDGDTGSYLKLLEQGFELYGCPEMQYVGSKGRCGRAPAARSKGFSDSGYYILRSGWGNNGEAYEDERYFIFDCGPLGAGNHGHLDLLNFEMAAYGQSLIVDPGRYTYDESGDVNWRVLFRGTVAHNTVLVDQRNQTRYEPGKRKYKIAGPRPDYELREFTTRDNFDLLHGIARSHEYNVVHERKVFFQCPDYWIVTDLLRAAEPHRYDLLFHLSASAWGRTTFTSLPDCVLTEAPHLTLAQAAQSDTTVHHEAGFASPAYGVRQTAPVIRYSRRAADACFNTVLYPWRAEKPEIRVTNPVVTADGEPCAETEASALCVLIKTSDRQWRDYYFIAHQPAARTYAFGPFTTNHRLLFIRHDNRNEELMRIAL
ncbi:MAG: alginate lyase family protein [Blastocatellia bacterium]